MHIVAEEPMTTALTGRPTKAISQQKRRIAQQRASGSVARRKSLPEYLEQHEVEALIQAAPNPQSRLLMLIQWRGGLRVSEALNIERGDLQLNPTQIATEGGRPTLRIRQGKGDRDRIVPCHPELRAALLNALAYGNVGRGPIIPATRSTAWRWVKAAALRAVEAGTLPKGKNIGTHTLRHSYARHLLQHGIPVNYLSRWMGHASIQTTLVYLALVPDPAGSLERVP